jgi:hypothetical protein
MAVRVRGYKSGDTSLPLANLVDADLAINRRPSLAVRVKGRAGHIYDSGAGIKWVDYANGTRYAVEGGVTSAPDAGFGGKNVATFASGGRVDLGNVMPVNADFTQIVVYRRANDATTRVLLGDNTAGAGWNSLHTAGTTGRISLTHNGNGFVDDSDLALANPHILVQAWNQATLKVDLHADGAAIAVAQAMPSGVSSARLFIGYLGFTPVPFVGQIAEVLVFREYLSGAALTAITSYLATDYGL